MIRWRLRLLGLLVLATLPARADGPEPPRSHTPPAKAATQRALPDTTQHYALDVTLDPEAHTLTGELRLRFVNHAHVPLPALLFHLYLNAFRDSGTVFMREGGTRLRGSALTQPGGIDLLSLEDDRGRDLLANSNDQLIPGDRTQLEVPLPEPLPPGAELTLVARFRSTLPRLVARSGFAGDFHMVAQWFPKLARLEPNGHFRSFPYHGLAEFYADFADYTLRVTMPRRYIVASGGVHHASELHGSSRTDTFIARAVHDLAFAAYPHFEQFTATRDGVLVTVFAPRGYEAAARRQRTLLLAGLEHMGRLFGPYPYQTLVAILPPRSAHAAAGMEYPTLIVSAGPWWTLPGSLPDPAHELVTAHELAHQWFSGMIASDEVTWPVLDEGLAEWAALDFLRAYHRDLGFWPTARCALGLDLFDLAREWFALDGAKIPSSLLPAPSYQHDTLASAVYLRPVLVFDALEQRHGRAKLEHALASYARAQRFEHPTFDDLASAFDAVYGPGFAKRVLEPALAGAPELPETKPRSTPSAKAKRSFFPELLALTQAFLHGFGP